MFSNLNYHTVDSLSKVSHNR